MFLNKTCKMALEQFITVWYFSEAYTYLLTYLLHGAESFLRS